MLKNITYLYLLTLLVLLQTYINTDNCVVTQLVRVRLYVNRVSSCDALCCPARRLSGTCRRRRCGRATPAGCAPPSSTTTTCCRCASWWCCSPSCSTSCACGESTSASSARPRPSTSCGPRRERPSSPEPHHPLLQPDCREMV